MKVSRFNLFFETGSGYLVYNTLRDSILRIDKEAKERFDKSSFDGFDHGTLSMLLQNGFVVDTDETSIFELFTNRIKYQSATAVFFLIPTHRCNLACTYCYQGAGTVLTDVMDEETAERALKFIKSTSADSSKIDISLYGGEPFLDADRIFMMLEDLQSYCQKEGKCLQVSGTTNGTLLDEDTIIKLERYPIEDIQITFAGPKRFHDRKRVYRDGSGTYDRLIEVIKNLEKHGIRYHIRVDVDEENFPCIGELLDDLAEKVGRPPAISIQKVSCDPLMDETRMISEIPEEKLHELYALAESKEYKTNPIYIGNARVGCGAIGDSTYAIDPKGDVYRCCAAAGNMDHRLGTIGKDGTLTDVNQEAYYGWTLRNPLQFDECRSCEFAPICFSGCALQAYSRFGDIKRSLCFKDQSYKNQYRANIETYLKTRYPERWRC